MERGDPAALFVMTMAALRLPEPAGLKLTEMPQWAPADRDVPQLLVCTKSPGLAPLRLMLPILRAPVPVLVMITDWTRLMAPTNSAAKFRAELLSATAAPAPLTL